MTDVKETVPRPNKVVKFNEDGFPTPLKKTCKAETSKLVDAIADLFTQKLRQGSTDSMVRNTPQAPQAPQVSDSKIRSTPRASQPKASNHAPRAPQAKALASKSLPNVFENNDRKIQTRRFLRVTTNEDGTKKIRHKFIVFSYCLEKQCFYYGAAMFRKDHPKEVLDKTMLWKSALERHNTCPVTLKFQPKKFAKLVKNLFEPATPADADAPAAAPKEIVSIIVKMTFRYGCFSKRDCNVLLDML